jgi:hypothetical protein
MLPINLPRGKIIIFYKILNDLLFLLLLFFIFALIAEGLIYGIISIHISFLKLTLLIFINLLAIYAVGFFAKINLTNQSLNKKIILTLTILGAILILNSLLRLNIFLAILILAGVLIAGYLSYRIIFENNS